MLMVGDKLLGYCGGVWSRDTHWESTRVEAVGPDWVVGRQNDVPVFATDDDIHDVLSKHCVRLGARWNADETEVLQAGEPDR
jgi:hypothetical protein